MAKLSKISLLFFLVFSISNTRCTDITGLAFNHLSNVVPAAYADYDSDELTDLFILHGDFHSFEILKGAYVEPLFLKTNFKCTYQNITITSIVPGDFDGDAFMDVLMTVKLPDDIIGIYISWGGYRELNCSAQNNTDPIIKMRGEPTVLDYNHDFIMDLFGLDEHYNRVIVVFSTERKKPVVIKMDDHPHNKSLGKLSEVAHVVLDLNHDYLADLCLSTSNGWEIWHGVEDSEFKFNFSHQIKAPTGNNHMILGQSLFLDFQLEGSLSQLVPVCFDRVCQNSSILIPHSTDHYTDLEINFKDQENIQWGFLEPTDEDFYRKTIILRGGDYNVDGYIDLIVTLRNSKGIIKTFWLENVKKNNHASLKRTFEVRWDVKFGENTIMGSFYDFYQDGIPDVILLQKQKDTYMPLAFRNTLDYDANFLKVIVLTGLENAKAPTESNRKIYGTNLPGPSIEYNTSTQEGNPVHGIAVQLPQSAYLSLHLPYTSFGLGRTPNFVEFLTVGLAGKKAKLTQLIPNSQIFVVPKPISEPDKWKSQLFITPSKIIIKSVFALGGICICIIIIIFALHIKERRQDKVEKLQEAHRFHFDAM